MKISNIEFTDSEWEAILSLAAKKKGYQPDLTPQNVIRLLLGQPLRQRGGARAGTGNRKPPLGTPPGKLRRGGRDSVENTQ